MAGGEDIVIKDEFQTPSTAYRSFPFWAWNDQLEIDEIKRQIISMKQQGIGGFFMHSRDGLETAYMGEEWRQCIRAAVETAKENGMYAWLYDEDRWPSGTAGGRVTKEGGDAFRCKGLTLEVCEPENEDYKKDNTVLALYGAKISNMDIEKMYRIPLDHTVKLNSGEKLLVARLEVSGKCEWFNNEAPPDNLNPEAVKYFIKLTHETYKDTVGEEFGKTVPGIFTDEPSLADRHAAFAKNKGWIPWTYGFEEFYEKRRGTDVFDTIPYIYFNCDNSAKARHDYWHTISERFSESYSKVISEWCSRENISYTGHFLQEDKLGLCARVNGAIMPHYQYQHIPGIDMLTEQTTEYMTVKQCTSVAHQFNRPIVLSETYGCTGWEFTFEGQKWVGDWQFALGVNLRCQHLALYSIRGCRKRDYPPSFNYNTSWWNKNHVVEDYFGRLSVALRQGHPIRKILLLHPMSTVWSRLGTNPYGNPIRRNERDVPELNAYGEQFNQLIQYLCSMHLDCDLGDEMIMAQYGAAENNKLRIDCAIYDVMVIPQVDTILRTTFELLKLYLNQGGKIVMFEPTPYRIEGICSKDIKMITEHSNCKVIRTKEDMLLELEKLNVRTIKLMNKEGKEERNLLYSLRKTDEGLWLFVVNNSREASCQADVLLPYSGEVERWDALTGQVDQVITENSETAIKFSEHWDKSESKLYFIKQGDGPYAKEKLPDVQKILKYTFPEISKVKATTLNVLTLDVCRYKMDGGVFSEKMEVWKAQYQVRQKLGMRQIHVNGLEQRYKWVHLDHPNDGKQLRLVFEFDIEKVSDGLEHIYLVLEGAKQFEIMCNDTPISNASEQWFLDRSFDKVLLKGLVIGKNQLKLSCKYNNAMELENCYIVGDFGVTTQRKIVDQPKTIQIGDWTSQGYFHYTGSLIYQYDYENTFSEHNKLYLDITDFKGVCACVKINEHLIDVPWAAAGMIPIAEYLKKGHNSIDVEIFASPRNMLGPFHLAKGKRMVTNDECFCVTNDEYTKAYNVEPYGLMSAPKIYIEK
jgi:hypothetical protein